MFLYFCPFFINIDIESDLLSTTLQQLLLIF